MSSLYSGLTGLSLLTGSDAFSAFATSNAATTVETRAQRTAKAAFTTPATTPPWKDKASTLPVSAQVSAVKGMKTIIDKAATGTAALPDDVQTSFTAYKALDRLRLLAEDAAKDTTSSTDRASLEKTFAKGLTDLKTFLAAAPSDKVDLSFGKLARQAQTVGVKAASSLSASTIPGTGISDTRNAPLAGFTGTETFSIALSQPGVSDSVTVDLSGTPKPPTLDSVADAMNAAIAAVPRRDANGAVVNDASGNPVPRWPSVKFVPAKTGEKWGMSLERAGFETVAIDQVGAGDALMVASGSTPVVASTDAPTTGIAAPLPTVTRLNRFADPTGAMTRTTLATVSAVDRAATDRLAVAAAADTTGKTKATTVAASATASAMATDAQGFGYVVGTSAGDIGGNLSHGANDLFLTKVDSEGQIVWQRNLGAAGTATGAAVTIAPDGGIVVAGSVTGGFDGANSDGDMMVARYDASGAETFSTLVRSVGTQTASAVAVGQDGSIFVGGQTEANGGDAFVARIDAGGTLRETRTIGGAGTDGVKALAIAGDGKLLVLTGESGQATLRKIDGAALATDIGRVDLGRADARAIAVAADGTIAVGGATDAALPGTQVNATGGGRDGFVARIDAGLSGAAVTYVATGGEDQVDSVAFMGGAIYAGGRTSGVLGAAKIGVTDGFVTRIDAGSGAIGDTRQFGTIAERAEAVQVSAVKGGNSLLGAMGLHRGTLTPTDSVTLEAQTSLRAGDEFSIRINGGALRKITIGDNDTLTTLADQVRKLVGTGVANVTTPFNGAGRSLRLDMKPGNEIEFVAGAAGKDGLAKLGLDARRVSSPALIADGAPKVRPGGSFALGLSEALRLDTRTEAANALAQVKQALSFAQSAYRSLYWDDTKALLADSGVSNNRKPGSTVIEQAQLTNYQAALTRLTAGTTSYTGF